MNEPMHTQDAHTQPDTQPAQAQPVETRPDTQPAQTAPAAQPVDSDRFFSQGDVDRIVQRRLADERARAAAQLERREQEHRLTIRRYEAESALARRNLPGELLNVIAYADESAFETALDQIDRIVTARAQRLTEERFKSSAATPRAGQTRDSEASVRSAFGL